MTGSTFLVIVAGSTLLDLAAALAVLLGRRSPPESAEAPTVGPGRVALAVAATSAAFLVKAPFWSAFGANVFGLVHLAYADLAVVPAASGLSLLLGRRRLPAAVRVLAVACLLPAPVAVYATWVEPFRLRVEKADARLSPKREGGRSVRVGVLTDLQTNGVTDYERRAVDRLMAERPDVIVLPGDVFQGTAEQYEATKADLAELLGRLDAPGGVYVVLGDTDGGGEELRPILPTTRIRLLDDEVIRVTVGDRSLTIGGVGLDYRSPRGRAVVDALERAEGQGDVRILVSHRPDVALTLRPNSRIDLVVSGHTHGGQVVVPGFGPPVTLSDVPRAVAAGGLHAIDGNPVYVSRGVGCERNQAPRIRFFCPPEVSVVCLKNRSNN